MNNNEKSSKTIIVEFIEKQATAKNLGSLNTKSVSMYLKASAL